MFFQVRNAAEFSRHIPAPAHAAPYGLWSPQTTLSPNRCRAGRHLKAAVLLPGDIAVPWPQLRPQPTAAVGTRGSGARRFYIITYQARSRNPLSLHRQSWCQTTQTSPPACAARLGLLQCSPRVYTIQTQRNRDSSAVLGPTYTAHLVVSLQVKFCKLPNQRGWSACNGQVQGWVNPSLQASVSPHGLKLL